MDSIKFTYKKFQQMGKILTDSIFDLFTAITNVAVNLNKNFKNVIKKFFPEKDYYVGYNGTVYLKIRKGLHTCELIKVGYNISEVGSKIYGFKS